MKVSPANSSSKVRYFSPHLLKKLEGVLAAPVTVLESPSGYGKTTALRYYLKDKPGQDVPTYWWCGKGVPPEISWAGLCRELTRIDPKPGKLRKSFKVSTAICPVC